MKYLRNKLVIILLLIANIAVSQDVDTPSNLKDFEGIWYFVPPESGYDSVYYLIKNKKKMDVVYWVDSQKITVFNNTIIGFAPKGKKILKLSDLVDVGQRMYFYEPNLKAPNDSIKYFQQASPSCFASFNGLGTDTHDLPVNGKPNYFLFNFNGREYEYHRQIQHLPNYVVNALLDNNKELLKVEAFLDTKYSKIKIAKSYIYGTSMKKTKMYLLKADPIEVIEAKDGWLKIRYYPEKNREWIGKTIEGWIKKTDVE